MHMLKRIMLAALMVMLLWVTTSWAMPITEGMCVTWGSAPTTDCGPLLGRDFENSFYEWGNIIETPAVVQVHHLQLMFNQDRLYQITGRVSPSDSHTIMEDYSKMWGSPGHIRKGPTTLYYWKVGNIVASLRVPDDPKGAVMYRVIYVPIYDEVISYETGGRGPFARNIYP